MLKFVKSLDSGFEVEYTKSEYGHFLCGVSQLAGSTCPNCKLQLIRMLSIDLTDPRFKGLVKQCDQLELLYCWACGICMEPLFYRIGKEIELLSYGIGERETDFPYENYPINFKAVEIDFERLDPSEQSVLEFYSNNHLEIENGEIEFDEKLEPRHQLGGIPFLYDYRISKCPICFSEMTFLATISDNASETLKFTGNPSVQVVFSLCKECSVVGARNECD